MSKCLDRWVDPTRGASSSAVGPYSCGRKLGHKGAHAWDGNGASALWNSSGELLLSIQQVPEGGLPELMDKEAGEAAEAAVVGVDSAERKESGELE